MTLNTPFSRNILRIHYMGYLSVSENFRCLVSPIPKI